MTIDFSQEVYPEKGEGNIPGVLLNGHFWYWDGVIDAEEIAYRRHTKSMERILEYGSGLSALIFFGIFVFGVFVYRVIDQADVLAWWLSVLSGCFFGYIRAVRRQNQRKIPTGSFTPERTSVPSLGTVSAKFGIFCTLTSGAVQVIEDAFMLAQASRHAQVEALHIFSGSMNDRDARVLFARLGVSLALIIDPLRRRMAVLPSGETAFAFSGITIMRDAFYGAALRGSLYVTTLDVLFSCYQADEFLQEVLFAAGVDRDAFEKAVAWLHIQEALRHRYQDFRRASVLKPTGNMNRAYTAGATPFLDSVSEDLTRQAVYGRLGFCIDRTGEISEIMRAIESGRQSVVLVGQPGVGRGAIIDGIAERMVTEQVPDVLKDKRLLRVNIPQLVSAEGGHGAAERLLFVLQEVAMSGNIVLVIENIHEIVGIGESVNLASLLASEVEKGYTFVIATSTPSGYSEELERSSLGPKLQKIAIDVPDHTTAIHILEAHAAGIEARRGVVFTYQALVACVELAERYFHESVLPTSALTIAEEAALMVSKTSKKGSLIWITKEDIAECTSARVKIPIASISQDEGERLLQLEKRLHERVIGQDQAIQAVASALRRARTALRSEKRPIGNFLFLGPTGVGKTELAKTTAEVYFGSENTMVRFDMSEYQDQASLHRLIGENGQAGLLTEAIRRTPFSLLLLDELEKAHPDILNIFLQVMDDGRLTDGLGRTIDFTNVIIIATSNAGTSFIQEEVGKGTDIISVKKSLVETELRSVYRPEFLNRFDDIIVFSPLSIDDVVAITYVMIRGITERLQAKGMVLHVHDEAVHELATLGYDPKFGARPLRRVLQEKLENVIAEYILRGDVGRRDRIVYGKGGVVSIEKAQQL